MSHTRENESGEVARARGGISYTNMSVFYSCEPAFFGWCNLSWMVWSWNLLQYTQTHRQADTQQNEVSETHPNLPYLISLFLHTIFDYLKDQIQRGSELLAGDCLGLNNRKSLSWAKEKLLGQLAVVAFRGSEWSQLVLVPTFPKSQRIWIACQPRQYKVGDGETSKRLLSARMKTRKECLSHLPVSFNNGLITRHYLDANAEHAVPVLINHFNAHLWMNTEDSSALMGFVGLSLRQYERLNRAVFFLFYWTQTCRAKKWFHLTSQTPCQRRTHHHDAEGSRLDQSHWKRRG